MFSEESVVEEDDSVSQEEHQESHTEVEDSQDDCVKEAASDHVIPAKVVDPVVLVDLVVRSDVSDSLRMSNNKLIVAQKKQQHTIHSISKKP